MKKQKAISPKIIYKPDLSELNNRGPLQRKEVLQTVNILTVNALVIDISAFFITIREAPLSIQIGFLFNISYKIGLLIWIKRLKRGLLSLSAFS
jgi:hypothetical protein